MIHCTCPHCRESYDFEDEFGDRKLRCANCQKAFLWASQSNKSVPIYEGAQQRHSRGWIKWLLLAALLSGGGLAAYQFAPRQDRETKSQQSEEPKAPMAETDYYRDYSKSFPWFPALKSSLTPEERVAMEKLRALPQYGVKPITPVGGKTTMGDLEALKLRVANTLDLRESAEGVVTGRAVVFTGEDGKPVEDKKAPANFAADFYPLFRDAAKAFQDAPKTAGNEVAARAEELLRRLLTHFSNQPLDGLRGSAKAVWMGNGYGWRYNDGGMGLRMLSALPLLKSPEARANFLENLVWIQLSVGAQQFSIYSTDDYLNVAPQCLAAIVQMQDSPAKWQRLVMMRHALETSVIIKNSGGTISPDGGVIHHGYAHNAYASYSFGPLCRLLSNLSECGVSATPDTDEVASRLARAGMAWAWIHQPNAILTNIEGRPGAPLISQREAISRPGADSFAMEAARTLMSLKRPANFRDQATRLLAMALTKNPKAKVPQELAPLVPDAGKINGLLTGSLAYPVSGAILQRRDDWLVSVRGTPAHRRGGEGMPYGAWGTRITLGGLYCKGSLMLVADGAAPGAPADLVSSGHAIEGRDMSLMPGVTAPILPWEKMVSGYFGASSSLSAPVALDGQGVWGFATETAAKSCFLFDNRITYATVVTNSKTPSPKKVTTPVPPLATTFIQFRHMDGSNDLETFDGKPLPHPAQLTLTDGQPHTLLAAGGHGYYLHPTTEALNLFRRAQESRFCEGSGFSAAGVPKPADAKAHQGNFTTGYWIHDPDARERQPVVFTLLVKSGQAGLDAFANRMKDSATAPARLTISPKAHILYDADTRMWGAVFFSAGERGAGHERNANCPLMAVDRPCSVAIKADPSGLTLAVSGGEELEKPAPFTLTLKGSWRLADGTAPEVATTRSASSAGDTLLTVGASAPAGNAVRLIAR